MKSIIVFILSLFLIGAASSQSYNRIPGKQDFTDSIKFSKYLNSVGEDSVLTIDRVTKKLKFVAKGGGMTAFTFMLNYDGKRFLMYTNGVLTDSTASGVKDAYGLGGIRIVDSLGNVYVDGSGISGGTGTDTSYLTNGDSILNIKNTDGDIQQYNFSGSGGSGGSDPLKLNISDTALMLLPYRNKINLNTDSITSLHNQIVGFASGLILKLNIIDTSAMLSPYKNYYPRQAISLTGSGGSYNNSTGVITLTGGSALPSQTGKINSYLTTDGVTSKWSKFKFNAPSFWESYGDSYTTGSGATVPLTENYIVLLAGLYNKTLTNRALSGSGLWRAALLHNTNINSILQPVNINNSMTTIMAGVNDINRSGAAGNQKTVNKVINGYKSIITNNFLITPISAGVGTGVTRTGTWNAAYNAQVHGGKFATAATTATNGSYIEYSFIGDNINVALQGGDGVGAIRATFDVTIDGSSAGSFTTNNQTDGINDNLNNNQRMPMVFNFPNLSDSNHVIRLTNTSSDTLVVDYFGIMKKPRFTYPMLIFHVPYFITYVDGSNSAVNNINNTIDSLVATYTDYPIIIAKTENYFTSYNADNIHPSTKGHRQIYEAGYRALDSLILPNSPELVYSGTVQGNNKLLGGLQVQGTITGYQPNAASGSGLELNWNGSTSSILSYNRSGSVYLPLSFNATTFDFKSNALAITTNSNVQVGSATDIPSSQFSVVNVTSTLPKGAIPAPRLTTNKRDSITSSILTSTKFASGSGYTNGNYTNVPLTGGSGAGAYAANFQIIGNAVGAVTSPLYGTNYVIGDTLSVNPASIGGTGSGYKVVVTTLNTGVAGLQIYNTDTKRVNWYDGLVWQYSPTAFYGVAAPSTTPLAVGDTFTDTVNKKQYVATGTASSADWTILN